MVNGTHSLDHVTKLTVLLSSNGAKLDSMKRIANDILQRLLVLEAKLDNVICQPQPTTFSLEPNDSAQVGPIDHSVDYVVVVADHQSAIDLPLVPLDFNNNNPPTLLTTLTKPSTHSDLSHMSLPGIVLVPLGRTNNNPPQLPMALTKAPTHFDLSPLPGIVLAHNKGTNNFFIVLIFDPGGGTFYGFGPTLRHIISCGVILCNLEDKVEPKGKEMLGLF